MKRIGLARWLPFFLLLVGGTSGAQSLQLQWHRTFGAGENDYGRSVIQTADGGFLVAGDTRSFGSGLSDLWLLRVDSEGDTLWTRTIGGVGDDHPGDLLASADGGAVICGTTRSSGAGFSDFWLLKVDSGGTVLWERTYGGELEDECWTLGAAADGGFLLVGNTRSQGLGVTDLWLVRTDSLGQQQWNRSYGGSQADGGYGALELEGGDLLLTGYTNSRGAGQADGYVIRTNSIGDTLWTRTFGGSGEDRLFACAAATPGGWLFTGRTTSWGAGGNDLWLLRLNELGDSLWTRTHGGADSDLGLQLLSLGAEGFFAVGQTTLSQPVMQQIWTLWLDPEGEILWQDDFGGFAHDGAQGVCATQDGGFVVTGNGYMDADNLTDLHLLRLESTTAANPRAMRRGAPALFSLAPAHPNPFNPATRLEYALEAASFVRLTLHDGLGRRLRVLEEGPRAPGIHSLDLQLDGCSSGLYVCRLETRFGHTSRAMVLLR
ncbi:MAG: hypothetical protein KC518_03540 [Candidatus Cloacimonetes bacterium]|nr:hypothetical protein [Candidatus Cloacimonadota bacterium]